ncbi:MAG: IS3 family transposase [Bacteroidales bacterium]|nr:IS3 family transposase [Candidatus Colicola caccequi]
MKGLNDRKDKFCLKDKALIIHSLRPEYNLENLLFVSGMKRATYYYHVKKHDDKYADIKQKIRVIFEKNKERYGYRRVCLALHADGIVINKKTVARLMQEMGLYAKQRVVRYRSYKGNVGRIAPNIISRDFGASAPNQKWTTDITQVDIKGQKCYLSPVLDMWNGEIISFTISNSPNLELVINMMKKAVRNKTLNGLIMHSDQGWHYQHGTYQALLREHHIIQSMSRKGNCLDNSMMENFFGLMKKELLYVNQFESIDQFKVELQRYIKYYNNDRIKLRLKMSPVQYRAHYQDKIS